MTPPNTSIGDARMSDHVLQGLHVLLLEDDALINMATAEILEEMGCRVTPFLRVDEALAAVDQELPAAAVLDVNVGEQTSYELAQKLRDRGVPLVFLTGYDLSSFGPDWHAHPSCHKPCDLAELKRALIKVVS